MLDRCMDCDLHKTCKYQVKGVIPSSPDKLPLFFVGEAPGRMENLRGLPFVGDAGDIFDKALKIADIDRKLIAIGNVIRCQPPNNRDPKTVEIKACAHFLDDAIKDYAPKIIVPMGNTALKRITGRTGILKFQGTTMETHYGTVVPAIHPAAILRNPDWFKDLVKVFKQVKSLALGAEPEATIPIKVLIADTLAKVQKVVERVETENELVVDLEATGFDFVHCKILCYALTWNGEMGIVIPLIGQGMKPFWSENELPQVMEYLKRIGTSKSAKIGHNIKFDQKFLKYNNIPLHNIKYDTMLQHYLIDENRRHGLKLLALQYTDLGEYDKELDKYVDTDDNVEKDYSAIPNEILWKYAAHDVVCTYRLHKKFSSSMPETLDKFYHEWMMPMSDLLTDVEYKGVLTDPVEAEVVMSDYIKRMGEKEKELQQIPAVKKCIDIFYQTQVNKLREQFAKPNTQKRYGSFDAYLSKRKINKEPFNFASSKQLNTLFFDVMKLKSIKKTKGGGNSTDAEVIEEYAKEEPQLGPIVDFRTLQKSISTFILPTLSSLPAEGNSIDFRVHTTFMLHGTVTGRLSSRRPNLQNTPRDANDIRNIYLSDPGCVLIQFDYAQAEFRMWGNYSRDPNLLSDLQKGLDIHKLVASDCFGVSYDKVTKDQRQRAKATVFGVMYGRGATSISNQYGMSVEEAEAIIKRFFRKYPKAKQWIDHQKLFAQQKIYVQSLYGRQRRLPEIRGSDKERVAEAYRQAINAPIQSAASDFTCHSALRVQEKYLKNLIDSHLLILIHDALVYNIPRYRLLDLVPKIRTEMITNPPNVVVPMAVDMKIGERYGSLKEISLDILKDWI